MKHSYLLIFLAIPALFIALFSYQQASMYFTRADVVVGSSLQEIEIGLLDDADILQQAPAVKAGSTQTTNTSTDITTISYHGYLFDRYFAQNKSPLAGHGEDFVRACQKYHTPSDCTLLPAIAKVETDLCKTGISEQQHNCWGFGGSGPNRIVYKNFPEAIDNITQRLMSGYGAEFFANPNRGALSYCGGHCTNWGNYVQAEREKINSYFIVNGYGKLF